MEAAWNACGAESLGSAFSFLLCLLREQARRLPAHCPTRSRGPSGNTASNPDSPRILPHCGAPRPQRLAPVPGRSGCARRQRSRKERATGSDCARRKNPRVSLRVLRGFALFAIKRSAARGPPDPQPRTVGQNGLQPRRSADSPPLRRLRVLSGLPRCPAARAASDGNAPGGTEPRARTAPDETIRASRFAFFAASRSSRSSGALPAGRPTRSRGPSGGWQEAPFRTR